MERHELVIIGAGPAGLAAAAAAFDAGVRDICLLERDREPGGILNQCIHNGFGLHTFKEELTGPEYAARYAGMVRERGIEWRLNTMVLDISPDRVVTAISSEAGLFAIQAGVVILAMGCRERARGALSIPGSRPAGIYSAGTAQRLVNMEGLMPGRRVVVLGSGDIGLIMARRMVLEGAEVLAVAELAPYSGGLKRNIVQCLEDYDIPLLLSHTVTEIRGRKRLEGVTLSAVDETGRPVPGTEENYDCDTLLLSVGLIPENELSRQAGVTLSEVTKGPVVDDRLMTSLPGVFACGNVLHVHDLVDYVSEEAAAAGRAAAAWIGQNAAEDSEGAPAGRDAADDRAGQADAPEGKEKNRGVPVEPGEGIRYTVPSFVNPAEMETEIPLRFRVTSPHRDVCLILETKDGQEILRRKRPVVAPGEMETVTLKRATLQAIPDLSGLRVRLEGGVA